ncbi:MAG: hypothetical protein ABSF67_19285 [Roseiarcus sp.]|jgi:hypothetical protein
MNALTYATNPQVAAPWARDPFAALFARVVRLAAKLGGAGLAPRGALALAQASRAAYRADFGFVVTQDAAEGATDVSEPSTAELLARLAALRENIRRARQHYGIDERDPANRDGRESRGDADRQ